MVPHVETTVHLMFKVNNQERMVVLSLVQLVWFPLFLEP